MQDKVLGLTAAALAAFITLASGSATRADEIKVMASTAMKSAFDEIVPVFEKASGHKVNLPYDSSAEGRRKLSAGEPFDIAMTASEVMEQLAKEGLALSGPVTLIAINAASLAYPVGKLKPDVSSADALKATVLAAKSMSMSDPALGGGSSNYFMGVAERLGITEQVRAKAVLTKPGQGAFPVGEGRAEIGIAQASEIALVPGVTGVPLFPDDPKSRSSVVAAISAKSAHAAAAKAFLDFLKSPQATAVFKAKGLQPG